MTVGRTDASLINGCTPSATPPTTSATCGTTNVSPTEESFGANVNNPGGGESIQPPVGNEGGRHLRRPANITAHGTGNIQTRSTSQEPIPWSPYHLHGAEEARRALAEIEQQQLSDDARDKAIQGPEWHSDLSE